MSNQDKVRVACVGAGYFARYHIEAWKRLAGVDMPAICDQDIDKARSMAMEYGITHVFADLETMLSSVDIDLVDLITPPDTHLALTAICANAGLHVISQKPLAPTLEEAEAMVNLAVKAGIRLFVHENFRWQPWYRQLKDLMNNGYIGENFHQATLYLRTGDGWGKDAYLNRQPYFRKMPRLLMYETGIHYIDTFRYLFGEVRRVYARLFHHNKNIAGEDGALVQFDFENGGIAVFDANRYNESNARDPRYTFGTISIEGSKGRLRNDDEGRIFHKALGQKEKEIQYPHEDLHFAGDCVFATQQAIIEAYLREKPFATEGQRYPGDRRRWPWL